MLSESSNKIVILVTGVGAIIGQGIVKSLRKANLLIRIIGLDRNSRSVGGEWCDSFYTKPDCEEDSYDYCFFWDNLLNKEKVNLIIPGIESDVEFFDSKRTFFSNHSVTLLLNRKELIAISLDKWVTNQKLISFGLPTIPTIIPKSWKDCISNLGAPPFLMKPRKGNGSLGIVTIYDSDDFSYWHRRVGHKSIVQRLVGSDNEEYTVGVFGYGEGNALMPIVLRRQLANTGATQYAEVVEDSDINAFVDKLNRFFSPLGPTNYQFRKDADKVYLLEINARFSASNSIRTAFGYNEALMSINFFLLKKRLLNPVISRGRAARYTSDFIEYL